MIKTERIMILVLMLNDLPLYYEISERTGERSVSSIDAYTLQDNVYLFHGVNNAKMFRVFILFFLLSQDILGDHFSFSESEVKHPFCFISLLQIGYNITMK